MPNAFDDLDPAPPAAPAAVATAAAPKAGNAFDDLDPVPSGTETNAGPDWKTMFSGLDMSHSSMTRGQRIAFDTLSKNTDGSKETQAQAYNQAYISSRMPFFPRGTIEQDWPAVKEAFAKNALGVDQPGITDSALYSAIGEHEKARQIAITEEYKNAGPFQKMEMLGKLFLAHTGQNVKDIWDGGKSQFEESQKPFVPLPSAPQIPDMPSMGMNSPAVVAGVWNSVKPLIEGVESPLGVLTLGGGAELHELGKVYPMARAALSTMSGIFTGLMAKSAYDSAEAAPAVFQDPKATLQQKITAAGTPVAVGTAALIGALGTALELKGPAEAKVMADSLKGKTPAEAATILKDDALKAKDPDSAIASQNAAATMDNITEQATQPKAEGEPTNPTEGFYGRKPPGEKGPVTIFNAQHEQVGEVPTLKAFADFMKNATEDENGAFSVKEEEASAQMKPMDGGGFEVTDTKGKPAGVANTVEEATKLVEQAQALLKKPAPEAAPAKPAPNAEETGVIGLKNADIDRELKEMGRPPATRGEKLTFEAAAKDASEKLKADPTAGQRLVHELRNNPRPITGKEDALLLSELNRLRIERKAAEEEFNDASKNGDQAQVMDAIVRVTKATDEFQVAADVDAKVGTENAIGLALRRMRMKEDYSLAAIERRAKVANGGRELNEEQSAKIRELAKQVEDTQKAFDDYRAQQMNRLRAPSRIARTLTQHAESARMRIRARLSEGRIQSGFDPLDVADHAIIGADYIARGFTKLADWSREMVKEFGEAIRPHLQAIFERAGEVKANEAKLQAIKTRTAKSIEKYKGKLESGDVAPDEKAAPVPLDAEAYRLKAENERVKRLVEQERLKIAASNQPLFDKAMGHVSGLSRASALSGYHTLAKLAGFTAARLIETPLHEATTAVLAKIPGFKGTFEKSSFEGGANIRTLAKFYAQFATKGMKEAARQLTQGTTEAGELYGNGKKELPRWYDFMTGNLHKAEKTPLLVGTHEMLIEKAEAKAIAQGHDVNDELVQGAIRKGAYDYANRTILQENNKFAQWYDSGIKALRGADPKTGETSAVRQVLATAIEALFTKGIIKTPANYVMQTLERGPAGLAVGAGKQVKAWIRGTANLTDAEATTIGRLLGAGAVGTAFFTWGAIDATKPEEDRVFGGYYQPGEKRGKNDVPFAKIRIGDTVLPHLVTHSPLTESAQMGATFMRVALSKLSKKDKENKGALIGVLTAIFGLAEQAPIANQAPRLAKLGDPRQQNSAVGQLLQGLIPQLVQNISEDTDKDASGEPVKRKPADVADAVKMGLPGLREDVPEKR